MLVAFALYTLGRVHAPAGAGGTPERLRRQIVAPLVPEHDLPRALETQRVPAPGRELHLRHALAHAHGTRLGVLVELQRAVPQAAERVQRSAVQAHPVSVPPGGTHLQLALAQSIVQARGEGSQHRAVWCHIFYTTPFTR